MNVLEKNVETKKLCWKVSLETKEIRSGSPTRPKLSTLTSNSYLVPISKFVKLYPETKQFVNPIKFMKHNPLNL